MRITLKNCFHGTEATINLKPNKPASRGQMKRAYDKLCGMSECRCGGVRGGQEMPEGLWLEEVTRSYETEMGTEVNYGTVILRVESNGKV